MARRIIRRVNLAGWLFLVLVMCVVEAAVRIFDLQDSVPAPSATLRALVEELSSGTLSEEIGTTLQSYVQGLALAIAGGVTLGVLIGSSRLLRDALHVVIEFLRPIPAISLIPLAILSFGLGLEMRRFVIAYAAVWPILIATMYGVRGSDRLLHEVARTSGASRLGSSRTARAWRWRSSIGWIGRRPAKPVTRSAGSKITRKRRRGRSTVG